MGCGPQVGPFPSRPIMGSIRGEGTPSRDETARLSISRGIASKIIPNLPILRINHEFKGIMVNMGRINKELNNFLT